MSTNFPTAIDELANPSVDPDNPSFEDTLSHAAQHANANDAIEAVQTKIGIDGDTDEDTHDFKLSGITAGDKAASVDGAETLTNKTLTAPKIDTISEETVDHGVDVDGLNIKDGAVTTEDAISTEIIQDDAVTAAKIETQEVWQEVGAAGKPAYENSWAYYHATAWARPSYMKDSLGFVHLMGTAKSGTIGAYAIFTLPAGYRPAKGLIFVANGNAAFGGINILANGQVQAVTGSNTYFSLDGVTFKAEA